MVAFSAMARQRRFLERPHTYLQAAAESHAKVVAGGAELEQETAETEPAEPSAHSRSAKSQRRGTKGRFEK